MKFIYQKPICCCSSNSPSKTTQPKDSMNINTLRRLRLVFLTILFLHPISIIVSQTPLLGIINQYASVISIDTCESKITVDNASNFEIDDEVLLMQMKGAVINQSNSSDFGEIENLGSAGLFEKNEIVAIAGNVITLKFLLINEYDVTGAVQLVSFPVYDNVVITDTLKAMSWDGSKGGVIAMQVLENLILEAPVDVSGKGFRGGSANSLPSDCNFLTSADDYHYDISSWRGSPKGEGIAALIAGKEQGRGAQANGGGGGNDHNSGGGGGANVAQAGKGGELSTPGFNCNGEYPGEGGKPIPVENDRFFLGGGGGAGHDNNAPGTDGGNGGGLAIILANNITANGYPVLANGISSDNSVGDGASGGGAGGTIVLAVNQINDLLNVSAKGGNGGDVENPSDRCIGPGGGGGGGRFVANNSNNLSIDLAGGQAGKNMTASSQCSNPSNGASAGDPGFPSPFEGIPSSDVETTVTAVLSQPVGLVTCENNVASFEFLVEGVLLEYQWQVNEGSGWMDINAGAGYVGENTAILEVSDPLLTQNGFLFRCIVSGPCSSGLISLEAELTVEPAPIASFDYNFLGNNQYQFENNSVNGTSYVWDFGDGMMSSEFSPEHTYTVDGQYDVTLTAINGCGEISTTQSIEVGGLPIAAFGANFDNPCVPSTVQFQDQSFGQNIQSYNWEFEGGSPPTSTMQNPTVTYSIPGVYDVELTVENSTGENTIFLEDFIEVFAVPIADFEFSIDAVNYSTVLFTNNSISGSYQIWDFGDGSTSSEFSPVHTYSTGGLFQVELTVANDGCGSTTSREIYIEMPNTSREEVLFPMAAVYPNPAYELIYVSFLEMPLSGTIISLLDLKGQFLQRILVEEKVEEVNVSNLPSGLYFLQINNEGYSLFYKITKMK